MENCGKQGWTRIWHLRPFFLYEYVTTNQIFGFRDEKNPSRWMKILKIAQSLSSILTLLFPILSHIFRVGKKDNSYWTQITFQCLWTMIFLIIFCFSIVKESDWLNVLQIRNVTISLVCVCMCFENLFTHIECSQWIKTKWNRANSSATKCNSYCCCCSCWWLGVFCYTFGLFRRFLTIKLIWFHNNIIFSLHSSQWVSL